MPDEGYFGLKATKQNVLEEALDARKGGVERHDQVTKSDLDVAYTLLFRGIRHLLIQGQTVDLPEIGTLIPKKGRGRYRLLLEPKAPVLVDMALFDDGGDEAAAERKDRYTLVGIDANGATLFERMEARQQPPFGIEGAVETTLALFRRHPDAQVIQMYMDKDKEMLIGWFTADGQFHRDDNEPS